ncbi:MAG: membrane protein insertase YidC, partial [Treponema sp.]|nr:membrane protein insertase YidC [Treponema sp.]
FYKIIPNYGVAIILLTLLVKVIMFPLTRKSSESTLRMQALSPKIKELQTKYKDNPQKLNQEMAEFYKKEGYNPMAGCLPMLIQIPIFFAMYNLFNTHFDLRGAMFIPGWIPDLSLPEAVFLFPNNFSLPFLGWTAIRALPFIYVASQLLYGKITQTPGQAGGTQMKIMMYGMPIIFFFILYDVPSGLLIYWIMSNVLTLIQQLAINKYLAPQRAALATQAEESLKLPPKKKRKR